MTLSDTIADKLGKLLRMLASDRDGEVVAAARAIRRTLEAERLDIHVLADGIGGGGNKFSEQDAIKIYHCGVADGRAEAFRNVNLDYQPDWNEIAKECAARPERLRDERERRFVADMVRWTVRGGEPTQKQVKWLRAIYARVRG